MATTLLKPRCFVMLLVALSLPATWAMCQDCSKPAAENKQAVVSLSVEITNKETGAVTPGSGTGFVVSPDGFVLTAYHVVASDPDKMELRVYGAIGSLYAQKSILRFVAEDRDSDIALLQFRDSSHLYVPITLGNPWNVKVGEQLCSLSFSAPLEQEYHPTTGALSSRSGEDTGAGLNNLWTTQMPSNRGESGAPVLDLSRGGVVALKYGGKKPGEVQNVNYLTPLNLAEPLLRKHVGLTLLHESTSLPSGIGADSSLRLEKVSGEDQIIPLGGWKNFAVRVVDTSGRPVVGAKVAWQTLTGGPLTYVGETDSTGISSATNLYTFATPGTHIQQATITRRDLPVGFIQNDRVLTLGVSVTFRYQQGARTF
jgi:hypothetical protein